MGSELFFVISSLLFALVARGLLQAIRETTPMASPEYSSKAFRVGRVYKVFAWSLFCLILFVHTLTAFIETFVNL